MNLEIGSIVGDYEIIGVLGAGGMGKVFRVRNAISNRMEAMKVLLPDLAGEPELADRFLREIQVLARLEHPNIAGLRTALRFENQLLMVMELVEGMSLDQRLHQGPLPVPEAVKCIDQILAALAFAHRSGVIHRDIKPGNMMLTPDGTVKLMDFGIAKGASDRRLTMTGGTVGSVYYMSPEQINSTEAVDARSDLYSVGVSFYELVTGKHAFDGDSQFAIMAAHLEKTPVPPITLDPRLPQALNDLILISVAREPDRRFQTAEAFRNALKSVMEVPMPLLTGPAVVAQAAPSAMRQEQKSHRALWATAGALCFVAVLVGAIQFGPWKKAAADSLPPKTQVLPGQVLTVEPTPIPPTNPPTNPTTPAAGQPVAVERSAMQDASAVPDASAVRRPMPAMERPVRSASPPFASPRTPNVVAAPPAAVAMQSPVQSPVQSQATVPVPREASPQPDPNAQRAELQKVRESLAMLSARAGSIHSTLQNLQRSQAASGLGMRGDWLQSATLMDTFLRGSNDALAAGDPTAAKDFMEKSERQIERLEKALNK